MSNQTVDTAKSKAQAKAVMVSLREKVELRKSKNIPKK